MSALKVGDRVRVEFEGTVTNDQFAVGRRFPSVNIAPDGIVTNTYTTVPVSACTVIVPPVEVGDLVTTDNLDQLGEGSIAVRDGYAPIWKHDGLWYPPLATPLTDRDVLNGDADNLRVVRIGATS